MKAMTQLGAWKSIRKIMPPKGYIERSVKGSGYRRRSKHKKQYSYETE